MFRCSAYKCTRSHLDHPIVQLQLQFCRQVGQLVEFAFCSLQLGTLSSETHSLLTDNHKPKSGGQAVLRVKSPKFDPTSESEIEEIEEDMDVPDLHGGPIALRKWNVYLRRSFGEILFGTKLNILLPSIPLAMVAVSLNASQVHFLCFTGLAVVSKLMSSYLMALSE